MVELEDIIIRPILSHEHAMLKHLAYSYARKTGIPTTDVVKEQNYLVGLIGSYVVCVNHFGTPQIFNIARSMGYMEKADFPGMNLDVKSSRLNPSKPILEHSLVVREKDFDMENVYYLVLVDLSIEGLPQAHIVGWQNGNKFPIVAEGDGPFKGAYKIKARELLPIPKITWYR